MHPSVLLLFKAGPLLVPSYLGDLGSFGVRCDPLSMNALNIDREKSFLLFLRNLFHGKSLLLEICSV